MSAYSNDVKEKLDCVPGPDSWQIDHDFRWGEMNCNYWLRRFDNAATEFMLCRRLHKLCKHFAILQNGQEIKKLGGLFSSLTLFIVDISLNDMLPPLPEVSSVSSWRPHLSLLSTQSSFSLTSLVSANDWDSFAFTGSRIYLL